MALYIFLITFRKNGQHFLHALRIDLYIQIRKNIPQIHLRHIVHIDFYLVQIHHTGQIHRISVHLKCLGKIKSQQIHGTSKIVHGTVVKTKCVFQGILIYTEQRIHVKSIVPICIAKFFPGKYIYIRVRKLLFYNLAVFYLFCHMIYKI